VTFAALTPLIAKNGEDSPKTEGAARLLDGVLPQMISAFQRLYPERLVTEVVLMGSYNRQNAATPEVLAEINHFLAKKNAAEYYPHVYVDSADTRLAEVCENMALKLNERDLAVFCPNVPIMSIETFSLMSATKSKSGNSTSPTQQRINLYQIELWVSLAGVFVVAWAIYVLGWMGFKKDTLLYSTFNPNWEDRKRH